MSLLSQPYTHPDIEHAASLAAALENLTADQKRQHDLIVAICNNMRDHALSLVKRMPPEWDGHELRELLADQFDHERTRLMREAKSKRQRRYKEYRSTCVNNNL